MSLEEQFKQTMNDFENSKPENIIEILNQIKPYFKSKLISEYLQGKIQKVLEVDNEAEKKKLCKALKPYFDWYLQGL